MSKLAPKKIEHLECINEKHYVVKSIIKKTIVMILLFCSGIYASLFRKGKDQKTHIEIELDTPFDVETIHEIEVSGYSTKVIFTWRVHVIRLQKTVFNPKSIGAQWCLMANTGDVCLLHTKDLSGNELNIYSQNIYSNPMELVGYEQRDVDVLNETLNKQYNNIIDIILRYGNYPDIDSLHRILAPRINPFFKMQRYNKKFKDDLTMTTCLCSNFLATSKNEFPAYPEEWHVYRILSLLIYGNYTISPIDEYEKKYTRCNRLLFSFKDKNGKTIMKAAKVYSFEKQISKAFIPITQWYTRDDSSRFYFAIPRQNKFQPLYNLHLMNDIEACHIVLCPNIEVADSLQKSASKNTVCTSWLGGIKAAQYIDFSSLENAKSISLLVCNIAGESLEQAYIEAEDYILQLRQIPFFKECHLEYIQLEMALYCRDVCGIKDFSDMLNNYDSVLGTVVEDSYMELTENNFAKMLLKAKERLAISTTAFYKDTNAHQATIGVNDVDNTKLIAPQFVLNPIIKKGEQTTLIAKKNKGKSMIGYSIASLATTIKNKGIISFIKERCWNVSRHPQYPCFKVLYLDFENGKETIADLKKMFSEINGDNPNFIIVDMLDSEYCGIDYTKPCNHQKIIDLVNKAKNVGNQGQPVDMIVLDTYQKFVRTETTSSSNYFSKLVSTLRKENIAIFVISQANDNDNVAGFKRKVDDDFATILAYREDATNACSISEHHLTLHIQNYRGRSNDLMLKEFNILFDENKGFFLVKDDNNVDDEKIHIANFVNNIHKNHDRATIARILGMSESRMYEKLKK